MHERMSETPLFFASGGAELFGMLHQSDGLSHREAFVFCHPFAEEKLWAHRVLVSFARELTARGYAVLRFDARGTGDSDGAFEASSVETMCVDVRAAIEEVRRRTGCATVSLLGLRLGATVASLIAEETPDLHRLVLWAPVVDGARYMQDMLRSNIAGQMASFKAIRHDRVALVQQLEAGAAVNIDGYEMALGMYAQCSSINLLGSPRRYAGPCLVVEIERTPKPNARSEAANLAGQYPSGTLAFVQDEPFWKENSRFYGRAPGLMATTLSWLETAS
jgi:uncharacterized protein